MRLISTGLVALGLTTAALIACQNDVAPGDGGQGLDGGQGDVQADTQADVEDGGQPADSMCPPNQVFVYVHPGCSIEAGICRDPIEDACAANFCACTGQWVTGCDYVSVPFQNVDGCAPGDW